MTAASNTLLQTQLPSPCPPVVAFQLGRIFRLDGRRLGHLAGTHLQVRCRCGHSGTVPVNALARQHGSETRVRDAVASMRCRHCGERLVEEVRWLG